MSFEVSADAYARFMGRFSRPLAAVFADAVGIAAGQRVLDVGSGGGALTDVVVGRVGVDQVAAVDPSEPFVTSLQARYPAMVVRRGSAEELPFPDQQFDAVLAQLVVHFMTDPVRGIAEMARVAVPGGVVAANVWDHAGGAGPLAAFWSAVRSLDPDAPDESRLPGVAAGHLAELFAAAGMDEATSTALTIDVEHGSFEEWWEPFTLGVGPAGAYVASLDADAVARLREACRRSLPVGPFTTTATAWTAWARTPPR